MQVTYEIDHTYYRTSIQEEAKFHPEFDVLKFLVTAGGCFAYNMTDEMAAILNQQRSTSIYRSGNAVVIFDDVVVNHTEDEVMAIYLHELGHFRLGHMKDMTEVLINPQYEMDADAFAADLTSKQTVKSALLKMIAKTSQIAVKALSDQGKHTTEEKLTAEFMADPVFHQRLAALN
ncbi:M48 family metalloprotease [Flavobacterium sp.]|jgi:Zn-dependent protease with chaperone function|uniref:M48 family metalloprotease n=1 Tax=Flavobacterium sp. TaxID=239 RepID=UPI0037C0DFF3